uniref:DNA-directed DNA polymerase n=1 Tax=Panagrolaimus sp. PS1159 TaxID=55785 RepID=A0AC35FNN7_9BILA
MELKQQTPLEYSMEGLHIPREPTVSALAQGLFGATPQMLLAPSQYDFTPFNCELRKAYFVNGRKDEKIELVKLFGSEKLYVNENFPNATFCYKSLSDFRHVPNDELFYDIFCPELYSAVLELPDDRRRVNALYIRDLEPRVSYGRIQLTGKYSNFNEIDQSVKPCTMEEFIEKKCKDGKISCWIIFDEESLKWKIFPCFHEPIPPNSFTDLWKKMKSFEYGEEASDFFGIVEYKLGSTYMCQFRETFISPTSKVHILKKAVPFTIDPELIDIFIDDDGKILIKTVVGAMEIPKLKTSWLNAYYSQNPDQKCKEKDILEERKPKYNIVMHPIFGKIILPRTLVWSADSTMVIFTFLFAAQDAVCLLGRGIPFVLAVHDGFNMVRLPIHLKTTIPAVKTLIEHGIELKDGMIDEREDEIHELQSLPLKGYQIDGAVLSQRYSKPAEKCISKETSYITIKRPTTHTDRHFKQIPHDRNLG